ncbi:hypothetical protein [Streptomyces sp. OE57]|uniref:hypothetical protein n=1 Tax=Streptomyces lacaronensis TaxID=3379885 RepID=UPI0039B763D0
MRVSARCTAAVFAIAGASLLGLCPNTAHAAARNYEAVICDNTDDGNYYTKGNVGGYNQNNQFVHTPNFVIGPCGYQPNWWFKPNQKIEVNLYIAERHTWVRKYPKFSSCELIGNSQRVCDMR